MTNPDTSGSSNVSIGTTTNNNNTTGDSSGSSNSSWRSLIYVPAKIVSKHTDDTTGGTDTTGSNDTDTTGSTNATTVVQGVVEPATLQVLDQLLLPHTISYISIDTLQKGWDVIHHMNIRGAPLIAIVAILTIACIDLQCHNATQNELQQIESMNSISSSSSLEESFNAIQMYIHGKLDYMATSRPTAVNLFNALQDVKDLIESLRTVIVVPTTTTTTTTATVVALLPPKQRMIQAMVQYAEQMLYQDEMDCRAIGDYGAQEINRYFMKECLTNNHNSTNSKQQEEEEEEDKEDALEMEKITVMTICNTGSLATANYGTALGVIRSLHNYSNNSNKNNNNNNTTTTTNVVVLDQVVVLETRPYNQGSRLTAFECIQDALPNPILICDNMITAFINNYYQTQSSNNNNNKKNLVIVVGADRIVSNGDTANKIGTYQLAVLAQIHQIPFYVAAPTTTFDIHTISGQQIHIEIRPSQELIQSSQAPTNIPVWNPAFDVTPAKYITGIITEKGVLHPMKDGTFDIASFLLNGTTGSNNATVPRDGDVLKPLVVEKEEDITQYTEQTVSSLPSYIATNVPEAMKILNVSTADEIEAVEMGDGNLNLVFIVSSKNKISPKKQIIVKQALPYVRCVGESWPLTLDRAYFEYTALQAQKKACPEYVPNLHYFCKRDALIVMEYLPPPIQILRKGLMSGIRYKTMAYDMGVFCAKTLFRTSGFALSTTELRERVEFWSSNRMMCALTEQVVFTEPYIVASNNHWTTPYLDDDKKSIETDMELKLAASVWKMKFVTNTEALIHADLHTGSVMCANDTDHQTYVIDPEFAFYGPAAFDTGALIANLLLSYVSQNAHHGNTNDDNDYDEWILQQILVFWNTFVEQFITYWNDPNEYTGFMYDCMKDTMLNNSSTDDNVTTEMKQCQDRYIHQMLYDTIGFAGMKMLRRIVGIAHVEDLESVSDLELRSHCERRGLTIAKYFIVNGVTATPPFTSMTDVIDFVRTTK